MLVFIEASGAFFLAFRIAFYYYADDRKDPLSWLAQLYGALALMLTPFWRMKEAPHYIEAWWFYWIVPHWPVMLLGGVLAVVYAKLTERN